MPNKSDGSTSFFADDDSFDFDPSPQSQISRLKEGLRKAKSTLLAQQARLLALNMQIANQVREPCAVGTVFHIETNAYRPLAGDTVAIISGPYRGKEALLTHVTKSDANALIFLKPSQAFERTSPITQPQPEPITLSWARHWQDIIAPLPGHERITTVMVSLSGGFQIETEMPDDFRVEIGQTVRLSPQTKNIIGIVRHPFGGELATVNGILNRRLCEIDLHGIPRAVLMGRFAPTLKTGDRVQIDESGKMVVEILSPKNTQFTLYEETFVTWNDIGGQTEAKRVLREAIVSPLEKPEIYKHYKLNPPKGILLWGPPGCGKTSLAKAVATEIARIHGKDKKGGFIYLSGSEVLSKWLGNSEAIVKKIFAQAREFKRTHAFPAIICIDEAEAVMRRRGEDARDRSFLDTLVPAFLTEMDGLHDSGAIVILLTNRPDALDPAIVRDGRVDHKIQIKRPNQAETEEILRLYLNRLPLAKSTSMDDMVHVCAHTLFSTHLTLRTLTTNQGPLDFPLSALRSGSLIKGIVRAAQHIAFRRDQATGKYSGLCPQDLLDALTEKCCENSSLMHEEALAEFLDEVVAASTVTTSATSPSGSVN